MEMFCCWHVSPYLAWQAFFLLYDISHPAKWSHMNDAQFDVGAETGAGGRIRDTHATGTGSIMGASTAGYCVGNLLLDKFTHSWEDPSAVYPANLASPLQILIDASNGASDYGNKFGEPLIAGYTRTFGMRLPDGHRREWIKPIMFRWTQLVPASSLLLGTSPVANRTL